MPDSHPSVFSQPSASRIHPTPHVIAIGSGKGGVGKTTVAVNLALAFESLNKRVGVFDCDIYAPNVPSLMGIHRRVPAQGFMPSYRPEDAPPYIEPLEHHGIRLMSIGLLIADHQPINPHPREVGYLAVQTIKDIIWGEIEYLILDMPPGWGELHETIVHRIQIDGLVAVTTPQELALLDTARSLKNYEGAGIHPLGLVKNMSYFECANCGERHEIFGEGRKPAQSFLSEIPVLQEIPLSPEIARGIEGFGHESTGPSAGSGASVFRELVHAVIRSLEGHSENP